MNTRFENTVNKCLIMATSLFLLFSVIFSLRFIKGSQEISSTNKVLLILPMLFIISLIVFLGFKFIDRLTAKQIKITVFLLFGAFLLCELFILVFFSSVPITDSYRCIDTAYMFLRDKGSQLDRGVPYYGYFCDFSNNNLFIMILYNFFRILKFFGISGTLLSLRILNAVLIFISVIFIFLSVKLLFGSKTAAKTLFIFALNPTLYFHIEWIYTLTFSLPIMTAILYFGLLIAKEKEIIKIILLSALVALLTVIGYLIRPTAIFPLFALIVIAVTKIKLNKKYFEKLIIASLAFLLVFAVSFAPLKSYSNSRFEKTLDYNFPLTHWVMMGLNEYGKVDLNDVAITRNAGKTKGEKQQENIRVIKQRISQYGAVGFIKHLGKKMTNTFTDGTHNIQMRMKSQLYFSSAWKYTAGINNLLFSGYCQAFRVFTYLFSLIFLMSVLFKKESDCRVMPFVITVLGAFVFYLIWETKQGYSLPFTPFLLVMAALGMNLCQKRIILSEKVAGNLKVSGILSILLIVLILGSASFLAYNYKNESVPVKKHDYSVNFKNRKETYKRGFSENEIPEFSQEFYTDKPFSYMNLYADVNDSLTLQEKQNIGIDIQIVDEKQNTVFDKQITAKKFKPKKRPNGYNICHLNIPKVYPEKYQKYTIKVKQVGGNKNDILWAVAISRGIDNYKGNLNFAGSNLTGDVFLKVGNKYEAPRISLMAYAFLSSVLIFIQLFLLCILLFYKRISKLAIFKRGCKKTV